MLVTRKYDIIMIDELKLLLDIKIFRFHVQCNVWASVNFKASWFILQCNNVRREKSAVDWQRNGVGKCGWRLQNHLKHTQQTLPSVVEINFGTYILIWIPRYIKNNFSLIILSALMIRSRKNQLGKFNTQYIDLIQELNDKYER